MIEQVVGEVLKPAAGVAGEEVKKQIIDPKNKRALIVLLIFSIASFVTYYIVKDKFNFFKDQIKKKDKSLKELAEKSDEKDEIIKLQGELINYKHLVDEKDDTIYQQKKQMVSLMISKGKFAEREGKLTTDLESARDSIDDLNITDEKKRILYEKLSSEKEREKQQLRDTISRMSGIINGLKGELNISKLKNSSLKILFFDRRSREIDTNSVISSNVKSIKIILKFGRTINEKDSLRIDYTTVGVQNFDYIKLNDIYNKSWEKIVDVPEKQKLKPGKFKVILMKNRTQIMYKEIQLRK